jgi:hypothetical protein
MDPVVSVRARGSGDFSSTSIDLGSSRLTWRVWRAVMRSCSVAAQSQTQTTQILVCAENPFQGKCVRC